MPVADDSSSATGTLNPRQPLKGRVWLLEQPQRLGLRLFRLPVGGWGIRRRLAPPLAAAGGAGFS